MSIVNKVAAEFCTKIDSRHKRIVHPSSITCVDMIRSSKSLKIFKLTKKIWVLFRKRVVWYRDVN